MSDTLAFEIGGWVVFALAVPSIIWLGWRTYRAENTRDAMASVALSKPMNPAVNFGVGVFLLAVAGFVLFDEALPNPDDEARLMLVGSFGLLMLVGVLHLVIGTMTVRRRRAARSHGMAA